MVMVPTRCRALLVGATVAGVLAGCSSGHPKSGPPSSKSVVSTGLLAVHVGLFGGPERPDGGMAESNAPQPDAAVSVRDSTGHTWRATTGRDGVATIPVPAGRYTVSSPFCAGPQRVTVVRGQRAHVQVACTIP
jgi:hypothetical protein